MARRIDIARDVASTTRIPLRECKKLVDAAIDSIRKRLIQGEEVQIREFGRFYVKTRAAKIARNIGKGECLHLPETKVAAFKPSKELKNQIKNIK